MIEAILPTHVASVEARGDWMQGDLMPSEQSQVSNAVEMRRAEFTTARACARKALQKLGIAPVAIGTGRNGEPLWPEGIIGCITHTHGYRAAAVTRATEVRALGVDAEPNVPFPAGVLGDVALPNEISELSQLRRARPEIHWDRVLFSAKESIFKAWFPLTARRLEFEDVAVAIDDSQSTFSASRVVLDREFEDPFVERLSGRFLVCDALVLTTVVLELERKI